MVIREFFRRWGEYRQLIRELKSYSDVELAELGMVRSACAPTAFDAAFGSPLVYLRWWLKGAGPSLASCSIETASSASIPQAFAIGAPSLKSVSSGNRS